MPYFKKPGVQILGRPRGIGAEIVVDDSASIAACAVADVTLRGSGAGGGGCVYGGSVIEYGDGERGLSGGLISNAIRRIPAAAAYVRGNRGVGGGRTIISGQSGSADNGGSSQASTFLDLVASGVSGGRGAFWTNWDEVGFYPPRAPALVTNPDGSEAGRGGFGGNGALSQSGLAGQFGKLFLKVLGF